MTEYERRIAHLETDLALVKIDVAVVKKAVENHLPTSIAAVEKKVDALSTRLNWLIALLFTTTLTFAIWLVQQLIARGIVLR